MSGKIRVSICMTNSQCNLPIKLDGCPTVSLFLSFSLSLSLSNLSLSLSNGSPWTHPKQLQSINVNNNYSLALVACCTRQATVFHFHFHTFSTFLSHFFKPTYRFVKHRAPQDFQSFVCPAAGVQFHCHSGPVFSGDAIWRNSARERERERMSDTSLV